MKKIIHRIGLLFIVIGLLVTWRSCFRNPPATTQVAVTPVVVTSTTPPAAKASSDAVPTKPATPPTVETLETIIPQFKGWKSILVGGMSEDDRKKLNEGDVITIRYLYQFQEKPEEVEMIPVPEKSFRKFTGSVIYDGIAGPENLPLQLKFASGKYSRLSTENGKEIETEISHDLYEQLMGTYSKIRVLPADEAGIYGYFEVKEMLTSRTSRRGN